MKRKKERFNGITALYERLSRDDDNLGDSNSIIHQKQMLEDYATSHGFTNLVHYTDDGWSGASFDRPAWNRLVEGVKNGEVTTVIAKDLSRIGRDHLQVGFFMDILFREKEIHFIAINNSIDSDNQDSSEFAPFLNIMNEWYVRDTSKKIKAVLRARGCCGKAHTSNNPPYGYLKDPDNPDHWVIDEEAAAIVRMIYQKTIEGKGPYTIARELSEAKIERPSYYLGEKGLGNHATDYDKTRPYSWKGNQIAHMIARPEYIGKTVNFRTYKNSYKDKRPKISDPEDWVVFDGTQEPIVDTETWKLAQKLRGTVRKIDSMGEPNVLTGLVYCADCGAPMYNHRHRNNRIKTYYVANGESRQRIIKPEDYYCCSTYNLSRQKFSESCSGHRISTAALRKIILETIQKTCAYVSLNEADFIDELQETAAIQKISLTETISKRLEKNKKRLADLDSLIRKIYEDNVTGLLPDRIFHNMLSDYEKEQDELNKIIEIDKADLERNIGARQNVERFLSLAKKYNTITELTPAIINEFIDKIVVHEATGLGAERNMRVDIYLNYIGQFTVPEDSLMTEEERIIAEKRADKLRRKRESNRRYMKKLRERNKAIIEADRKLKHEQAKQTCLQRIEEAKRDVESDTSEMYSEDTTVSSDASAEAVRVDRNFPDHALVCSA